MIDLVATLRPTTRRSPEYWDKQTWQRVRAQLERVRRRHVAPYAGALLPPPVGAFLLFRVRKSA